MIVNTRLPIGANQQLTKRQRLPNDPSEQNQELRRTRSAAPSDILKDQTYRQDKERYLDRRSNSNCNRQIELILHGHGNGRNMLSGVSNKRLYQSLVPHFLKLGERTRQ